MAVDDCQQTVGEQREKKQKMALSTGTRFAFGRRCDDSSGGDFALCIPKSCFDGRYDCRWLQPLVCWLTVCNVRCCWMCAFIFVLDSISLLDWWDRINTNIIIIIADDNHFPISPTHWPAHGTYLVLLLINYGPIVGLLSSCALRLIFMWTHSRGMAENTYHAQVAMAVIPSLFIIHTHTHPQIRLPSIPYQFSQWT